jgi:hypothetical protein
MTEARCNPQTGVDRDRDREMEMEMEVGERMKVEQWRTVIPESVVSGRRSGANGMGPRAGRVGRDPWAEDRGQRTEDLGLWVGGRGWWMVGREWWTMDGRRWTVDNGGWKADRGQRKGRMPGMPGMRGCGTRDAVRDL